MSADSSNGNVVVIYVPDNVMRNPVAIKNRIEDCQLSAAKDDLVIDWVSTVDSANGDGCSTRIKIRVPDNKLTQPTAIARREAEKNKKYRIKIRRPIHMSASLRIRIRVPDNQLTKPTAIARRKAENNSKGRIRIGKPDHLSTNPKAIATREAENAHRAAVSALDFAKRCAASRYRRDFTYERIRRLRRRLAIIEKARESSSETLFSSNMLFTSASPKTSMSDPDY